VERVCDTLSAFLFIPPGAAHRPHLAKDLAGAPTNTVFTVAIQYNSSNTSNKGQVAYIYVLAK